MSNILGAITGVVLIAAAIGWVMNIFSLFAMATGDETAINIAMLAIRVVGFFVPPVGAVVGYL